MSAEIHLLQPEGAGEETSPNILKAPELDLCNHYSEAINPIFDPKKVLFVAHFFIN